MSDREQLIKLYHDMYAAMVAKDEDELRRVHDDSFVLIHMTGMNQSKEAEMRNFSKMFSIFLLAVVLILSLAACGSSTETKESGKTENEPAKPQESVTEKPIQEDAAEDSKKPSEAGTDEQVSDDTTAGSGLSGFDSKLSSACPDSTVGEGLAIAGTDAQNNQDSVKSTVNDWLSDLGY